jgi:hypothetical protein
MKKERVSKVVVPENRPSQQEWMEQLRVSSAYVKPVDYFKGNEFNTEIFSRNRTNRGLLSGIINFLTNFTWAV